MIVTSTYIKSVNDVIALVESKEMARNALPSSMSAVSLSTFRRQCSAPGPSSSSQSQDLEKKALCPNCQRRYNLFTEGPVVGTQSVTSAA